MAPTAQESALTDGVVSVRGLTKCFGTVRAVDDLSFDVTPGRVTGFLGPNGSGKTTTLRMVLGLTAPTAGTATISGQSYRDLASPLNTVGAALEATSFHPGRTGLDNLRTYAPLAGASDARCAEVLDLVGLGAAAERRAGTYSLGMRQRLGLATTLLGDPRVLLLDEPSNGLDPEGIRWLRGFLRFLAGEGRTVLVSSHMLTEVQQSVDDVVIIARGRLVHSSSMEALGALSVPRITLMSPDAPGLERLVAQMSWSATNRSADGRTIEIENVTAADAGAAAFTAGLEVHGLADRSQTLEETFLRMVEVPPGPQSATTPATLGKAS
ncbi:ABC transporter ATP-binding protein [Sanguibacter antarcticus]|uniref:ABC-2 type transport system ATP-binding protein n=1 Tax=Sanguibacter antarcticus TaxID=372484 RepID=A0A2A9E169_9MICO|nr:ABC transporter ATP-binding protein [Sanguibacter antarcticus]PFG32593.1 ABC-2 type transport system ATP-binding protein [Sanguibacter antarcticus]